MKGFAIEEGLLVNNEVTLTEECRNWIVVPTPRRKELLKLAHNLLLGGHFHMARPFNN